MQSVKISLEDKTICLFQNWTQKKVKYRDKKHNKIKYGKDLKETHFML